jgi:hypothetical protein
MGDNEGRSCPQRERRNEKNSVGIVTNTGSVSENELSSTSSYTDPLTTPILVIPVNYPSTWRGLTNMQKETIVRKGTPDNPQCFQRDSSGRCFPTSIFFKDLPNGEKVKRDWLVWSSSTQ